MSQPYATRELIKKSSPSTFSPLRQHSTVHIYNIPARQRKVRTIDEYNYKDTTAPMDGSTHYNIYIQYATDQSLIKKYLAMIVSDYENAL